MKEFAVLASFLFPKHIEHLGLLYLLFPLPKNSSQKLTVLAPSLLSSALM